MQFSRCANDIVPEGIVSQIYYLGSSFDCYRQWETFGVFLELFFLLNFIKKN